MESESESEDDVIEERFTEVRGGGTARRRSFEDGDDGSSEDEDEEEQEDGDETGRTDAASDVAVSFGRARPCIIIYIYIWFLRGVFLGGGGGF